jgi:hypothetical protein
LMKLGVTAMAVSSAQRIRRINVQPAYKISTKSY